MFRRSVAVSLVSMVLACLSASSGAVSWMGNTKLYEGGNRYPNAGFYLEDSQSLTITTETWPIATGQQVKAIVTTNNWQTSQEYVFSFDFNANNNSHWYCVLPKFPKNTRVQFYLRADEWQNGTVFDNNGSQNFRYFVRPSPRYSDTPILQWFQTDYKTIMARLPEVVQAGYGAIYLPAPQKSGGGGFSTGYNPFDPFDLGDRLAKGTVRTQYGTTQELQELIAVAKRLGIEVYCDLVLNHMDNRASTNIGQYPGVIPEDFHIKSSANPTGTEVDFNNAPDLGFNIFNYDLLGLADIAHEDGNVIRTGDFTLPAYASFNTWGKPSFIRSKTVPQYYPGTGTPVPEDIREYLKRWGHWLTSTIGFDGFRLDAVKHMPPPFLGYAPDQPTGGMGFANGDMMNFLYSKNPNLYIFGENFTSNAYAHREYLKAGTNLLDFPGFFNLRTLLNSNGFADISAALSNGYGVDGNGLPFQNGGLAPSAGIGFVQSHDDGPPTANNLGHAFLLTKPGRPKIYYDGNNIQPGNWSNFPRPGRGDALGDDNSVVSRLVQARRTSARGILINRATTSNLYVYERQVGGKSTALVGLNNRGDFVAINQLVQTAFPAGTELEDKTGQMGNLTVDSNSRVTISVPANGSTTEPNNGRGYVVYAPISPKALPGVDPIEIRSWSPLTGDSPLASTLVTLPKGTYGGTKTYTTRNLDSEFASFYVKTDASGNEAFLKLNSSFSIPGLALRSNTPEGLTDGYVQMTKTGAGQFSLRGLDLGDLPEGLNVAKVRVFRSFSGAPVFEEFTLFFHVSRPAATEVVDGMITTPSPIASQTKTPSSNSNRADGLYVTNDGQRLYIGVAGRVDPSEGLTNGMMVFMDTDPGTGSGFTAGTQLFDDSGPAARLLSNRRFNFPSGFGADLGLAMFRNATLGSAPESPFDSQSQTTPKTIGAFAGAFRLTSAQVFNPLASKVAYVERTDKTMSPRGLEASISLHDILPANVAPGAKIGFIVGLGTTGETGGNLTYTDLSYEQLGGRPAKNPYQTNQILPSPGIVSGDPGFGSVNLTSYAQYTLQFASAPTSAQASVDVDFRREPVKQSSSGFVYITVKAHQALTGPVTVLIKPTSGVRVRGSLGNSLLQPGYVAVKVSDTTIPAGTTVVVPVYLTGGKSLAKGPVLLRTGKGIY